MYIAPILITFAVSALLTSLFACRFTPLKILDHPNERSLHENPVHRTGGLGLLAGGIAGYLLALWLDVIETPLVTIVICAAVLMLISFLDDLKGLSIGVRFVSQLLVSLVVSYVILDGQWLWVVPVTVALVWMINLYNFMDGMDGFAGGMAAWGFGALAAIALLQGAPAVALACLLVVAASIGFLLFNFPPARIFMGDAGSTLIGFLAGLAILYFHVNQLLSAGLGILIFSPFIVDATVTLLRRILAGERFWQAHRTHYYQRLVQAGWGHRRTVLAEYGLMGLTGGSAILLADQPTLQWYALIIWLVAYAGLMLLLEKTVVKGN